MPFEIIHWRKRPDGHEDDLRRRVIATRHDAEALARHEASAQSGDAVTGDDIAREERDGSVVFAAIAEPGSQTAHWFEVRETQEMESPK